MLLRWTGNITRLVDDQLVYMCRRGPFPHGIKALSAENHTLNDDNAGHCAYSSTFATDLILAWHPQCPVLNCPGHMVMIVSAGGSISLTHTLQFLIPKTFRFEPFIASIIITISRSRTSNACGTAHTSPERVACIPGAKVPTMLQLYQGTTLTVFSRP